MMLRFFVAALATGFVVGGCTTGASLAAFDPAACYPREFNVYFEGQTTEISPEARDVIVALGEALRGCRINQVRIIGSADAGGAEMTNEEISEQRAQVLADFLERRAGWPRSRMQLLATGERGAVTDEGLNVPMRRRAHISVDAAAP